jgi:soluble lytic murein transglycosylase-like protein
LQWFVIGIVVFILLLLKSSSAEANPLVADILHTRKDYVEQTADAYGVPAKRVFAIIAQESGNNEKAEGAAGEIGLMQVGKQVMLDYAVAHNTAKGVGLHYTDLYDPVFNVDVGTWQLSQLVQSLDGDLDAATQAYNAGFTAFILDRTRGASYLASVKKWEQRFT